MRMRLMFVIAALSGCSSPNANSGFTDGGSDPTPIMEEDGGFGSKQDAGKAIAEEVFGHSGKTLYRLNPTTNAVTPVGDFNGCASDVTDIAINEAGEMFGTSRTELYAINKTSAACTLIKEGAYPNSLSFLPKGTLDASEEALVGFEDADYVRIDTTTGRRTIIKANALPSDLISSGDIVSVKNGPTYLTVKAAPNKNRCKTEDCLIELDPVTGGQKAFYGQIAGYQKIFGLAFWAGAIYGFTDSGALIEIRVSGTSLNTKNISIPNAPAMLQFYGAGSSTAAPVGPK